MGKKTNILSLGFGLIMLLLVVTVGLFFLDAYFVMLLWNWVVPTVMWLNPLTFWHAVGFKFLISFLFKGGFSNAVSKGITEAINESLNSF